MRRTAVETEMEQTELMKPRSLDELIQILHRIFEGDHIDVDEVQNIMESYESNPQEWMKYAKFDQYRYTRHLVDEGNGKFNLMILCWGEGHGSSIHDHTNSHCFLKMLQGQLKETLFEWPDSKGHGVMRQKSERVLQENKAAYINATTASVEVIVNVENERNIKFHVQSFTKWADMRNDSIGLHRVENVSHTECAASLHLYSPPFQSCQTFDQRTGHRNSVKLTFWSKYGNRTPCETTVSQENN